MDEDHLVVVGGGRKAGVELGVDHRQAATEAGHRRRGLVISDTVTSVVTASRATSGKPPMSGAEATTTRVINGKIVTHVTRAIL